MSNPYLHEFALSDPEWAQDTYEFTPERMRRIQASRMMNCFKERNHLVRKYAWAVPSDEALELIKKHSPEGLVEIGAGTGYWAHLLEKIDVDVSAFDIAPGDNFHAKGLWTHVEEGTHEVLTSFKKETLFLCWPPYDEPMAYDCLKSYQGEKFIYVGELAGGCTGCDRFSNLLNEEWDLIEQLEIPNWFFVHDRLFVFKRKDK